MLRNGRCWGVVNRLHSTSFRNRVPTEMPVPSPGASHAALSPTRRLDPAAAAIELVDVHFAYDRRAILKGITMSVPPGNIVAIMGASGSGKTTILRLMGGAVHAR